MNKTETKEFLCKLEFLYGNLESEWSIEYFSNDRNVQKFLKKYLLVFEEKILVEIIENNKFRITNLPSSMMSSIL